MFLLGHASWSYVISKLTARELNVSIPAWLALLSGIIPDYDILFSPIIAHHTWTHSLVVLVPVAFLLSVWFGRMGIALSAGILSHLLTDSLVGSIPIFYPLSNMQIGISLGIPSLADTVLEVGMFVVVVIYAYYNGDYLQVRRPNAESLWLIIPLYSIIILSVLFAGDNSINLTQFAFSRKALSFITLGHAAFGALLSLGVVQGARGVWIRRKLGSLPEEGVTNPDSQVEVSGKLSKQSGRGQDRSTVILPFDIGSLFNESWFGSVDF